MQSEVVVKELKAENRKLANSLNALRIENQLNHLKLNELKKRTAVDKPSVASSSTIVKSDDVITIDSDDD